MCHYFVFLLYECTLVMHSYYVPLFCTLIMSPYSALLLCDLILHSCYETLFCTLIMCSYSALLLCALTMHSCYVALLWTHYVSCLVHTRNTKHPKWFGKGAQKCSGDSLEMNKAYTVIHKQRIANQ